MFKELHNGSVKIELTMIHCTLFIKAMHWKDIDVYILDLKILVYEIIIKNVTKPLTQTLCAICSKFSIH